MTDSTENKDNHFKDWNLTHWAYQLGKPSAEADFKSVPEDFVVTEKLSFDLTGEGENLFLLIEKRGLNTQQVCQHLAKVLGKRLRDIGYAGLKDKQSVSRQWFSVQSNVTQELDLSKVETDQIKLIDKTRHLKKLKVGALAGNAFSIRLRNVSDLEAVVQRLEQVKVQGVPNYFGLQRFGFNGNNLNWADRWASGEAIRDKKIKGFALSGARSFLFNEVISARLNQGLFETAIDGDVFMLTGSNSFFQEDINEQINERLKTGDISISGPLYGLGDNPVSGKVLELEQGVLSSKPNWLALLESEKLEMQRRSIQLRPSNVQYTLSEQDLLVSFELPSGAFATSVLRECVQFRAD